MAKVNPLFLLESLHFSVDRSLEIIYLSAHFLLQAFRSGIHSLPDRCSSLLLHDSFASVSFHRHSLLCPILKSMFNQLQPFLPSTLQSHFPSAQGFQEPQINYTLLVLASDTSPVMCSENSARNRHELPFMNPIWVTCTNQSGWSGSGSISFREQLWRRVYMWADGPFSCKRSLHPIS